MNCGCLATIAVGLMVVLPCGAGELELARRGVAPDCTIVLRSDAPENERYAAEELRDWTEKLTGVRLAIGTASTGKAVFLNRTAPALKYGSWYPPFDRELGNCHTFLKLVPPSKHFDAHPEYFSFFKGKRQKDHTQLCLTNPDVSAKPGGSGC